MTKMTTAFALVDALIAEGVSYVFGLFGHGNVQLGQALQARKDKIRFITVRNEQAGVHAACAIARLTGRPQAVTTSVGPGATNLVTGAAMARINRWPVLLLPGEIFAENVGPLLQQLEGNDDRTANDALRPVSKYWTRLNRASRLRRSLREAFDAMLEPGDEGPATICLPMDVQAEACEFDTERFFAPRDSRYPRVAADAEAIAEAAKLLANAKSPMIIAGGGVLRSKATAELCALAEHLTIPIAPTQAGKGSVDHRHPLNVFGVGPTGAACGNHLAQAADVIIGVGTRYSDFTTASETAFNPQATMINLNICAFDVGKQRALKLWGDAKATLSALAAELNVQNVSARGSGSGADYSSDGPYFAAIADERAAWLTERAAWCKRQGTPLRQTVALGLLNDLADEKTTVISAAGTLPGDLQKLWLDKDENGYLCEYGYSTMGFEIPAGLGAAIACPERRIVVTVGDLSFLMMPAELVTAAQQGVPFTVIVFDNSGGQSIRHLQRRSGLGDYGMEVTKADGSLLALDFAAIAEGMGCKGLRARTIDEFRAAYEEAATITDRPTVIDLKVDKEDLIGGYDSWWDVPQPELDQDGQERPERAAYEREKSRQVIR